MAGRTTGRSRKRSSAVLDAMAEALVLIDPNDESSCQALLDSILAVAKYVTTGHEGSAVAEALTKAEEAARRLLAGQDRDTAGDLRVAASAFEVAKAELTQQPALERSRAGSGEAPAARETGRAQDRDHPLADDAGLVADFVSRAQEHLDNADTLLLRLEQHPEDRDALDATFRVFHTIKGMAGFLGFSEIERFAHDTESFLDGPRKGKDEFTPQAFDAVFAAVDAMRALVAARAPGASASPQPTENRPGSVPLDDAAQTPVRGVSSSVSAVPTPGEAEPIRRRTADTIVRVDEDRLDLLLDTIGELVIAEAMASDAARSDAHAWNSLGEKLSRLDKITRELQVMATSLRMVPLTATFGRMARLARDLGQKAGKSVSFVTEGEETELDKAMVDLIHDPLVHLLRNSVDHGLEAPAERTNAGKPDKGTITLRAYHAGGSVCIEITDDGRGLDSDAILARARTQGLVADGAALSAREIHDLIFLPGFTTAQKITDVSGRGVGMDVVKRTVEGLRGTVEVNSTLGAGTKFTLRLPLTLAIIDGMVLRVGSERFIVPTLAIQRSLRPAPTDLSTVVGKGEVLATSEGVLPLIRLARLFDVEEADTDPCDGIVVLVGENGGRVGLVASELLGQQQTVIKPLGHGVGDAPGVSGGAIMPDGTVGLILDVSGLVRLAHTEGGGE